MEKNIEEICNIHEQAILVREGKQVLTFNYGVTNTLQQNPHSEVIFESECLEGVEEKADLLAGSLKLQLCLSADAFPVNSSSA